MTRDPAARRAAIRAGFRDAAPMLLGTIPFGLVAGATPVAAGLGVADVMGLSLIVFAGASQIATAEVLTSGGSVAIAVLTAWTINLRLILYSASLAPTLAHESKRRRLLASYFLVDQAYALAISRWDGTDEPTDRLPYFFAVGGLLGSTWLAATYVGAVAGSSLPADIPLDFMVPLVFLVLVVPAMVSRPAILAAVFGGGGAVVAHQVGAGRLAVMIGGLLGIGAGTVAEILKDRRVTISEVEL